jgi:hypothetical protein
MHFVVLGPPISLEERYPNAIPEVGHGPRFERSEEAADAAAIAQERYLNHATAREGAAVERPHFSATEAAVIQAASAAATAASNAPANADRMATLERVVERQGADIKQILAKLTELTAAVDAAGSFGGGS